MSLLLAFDVIDAITGAIGTILYPMFSIIFLLVDAIQNIFSAFAGIGDVRYRGEQIYGGSQNGNALGGGETEQGIVYYLMQHSLVQNLLISIAMLALLLIIIFTVMAFLRNMYAAKQKNWKEIIGAAIKGLANFIFLPVCCLFGVWLGNILLQAINGATSTGGATDMSRKLFISCAYNANLFRAKENPNIRYVDIYILAQNKMLNSNDTYASYHNLSNLSQSTDKIEIKSDEEREYYANLVDSIFAETDVSLHTWGWLTKGVGSFYSLWQINYLILIVGGIFMLYVLGALSFAMVRRLFYILVLFVISPALCAMYPLDDGKAVGSWKSEFIKQVLSAYGAVAGLNIFFSLLPLIDKIDIYASDFGLLDSLIQLFVTVSGLMIVKELMSLISGFVGGDDAYGRGTNLMKATTGAVTKYGGKVGAKAAGVRGAFARANAVKKAGGSWAESMSGSIKDSLKDGANSLVKTGLGLDFKAYKKTIDEAKKDGAEHPFKAADKKAEKLNKKATDEATKEALDVVKSTIEAYSSLGLQLTDGVMNDIIKGISNKDAQKRAAAMMAAYNNSLATNAKDTTTAEKVLDIENKLRTEEARRQDAFAANTDYTMANTEYTNADTAVGDAEQAATRAINAWGNSPVTYNSQTGQYTGAISDAQIENLRMAAEAPTASQNDRDEYQYALKAREAIEKHKAAIKERKQKEADLKRGALSLASEIEKLADNYKGDNKSSLITIARQLKMDVNQQNVTAAQINTAISNAMSSIQNSSIGTEVDNILKYGHK